MGRCQGKGKKLNEVNHEDRGSGEEEKIPVQRKRGRPLKVKQEIHRDDAEKIEDDERENASSVITTKERTQSDVPKRKRRRRRNSLVKVKDELAKEEAADETKSSTEEESVKLSGFRHSGSRRKNKPCRAAGAVVECN